MGITISYRMKMQKVYVEQNLDAVQKYAEALKKEQAEKVGIDFGINRIDAHTLYIDIGECETLALEFMSVAEIKKGKSENGYSYAYATLTQDGEHELDEGYAIEEYKENELYYCSAFCKTQFANSVLEHKWVADLIRIAGLHARRVEVYDEGEYYHSGKLKDAEENINENGAMIDSLVSGLKEKGYETDDAKKGSNLRKR